jgi:pyrroline-5-carboxylate reductase
MNLRLTPDNPMLLFGCGNMGGAMLAGWLAAGIDPASFVVVDPFAKQLPDGVIHHSDSKAVMQTFGIVLVGIKPQIFGELATDIERLLTPNALVISILAGTRTETLNDKLPGRKVMRLMPNLAAAIGKSPMGLFSPNSIDQKAVDALIAPLGTSHWLKREEQIDSVTALAGSGPAFVYRFIDALTKAGAELGLDAQTSLGLAKAMVSGAAELAARDDASPEDLARRVTSPGGTTAAGLAVLDKDQALDQLIATTVKAARDRGAELAKPGA